MKNKKKKNTIIIQRKRIYIPVDKTRKENHQTDMNGLNN